MHPNDVLAKYERTHAAWVARLAALPEDAFDRAPPAGAGGWTIGQVGDHLGRVADLLLGGAETCAQGEGERRGFQFGPWFMCAMGSFPPIKIRPKKVDAEMQALLEPESFTKDQFVARLEQDIERARGLVDAVAAADPAIRGTHPVGVRPNARQWYQMAEMHLRHHLRQLDRLLDQ